MKMRVFLWGQRPDGKPPEPCCGKEHPPEKWGPLMWQELHARPHRKALPFGGLIDRRREFSWLVDDFIPRIPCEECREHFLKHLLAHKLPETAEEYADWTIEYHNVVNAKLGKPRWRQPEHHESDR